MTTILMSLGNKTDAISGRGDLLVDINRTLVVPPLFSSSYLPSLLTSLFLPCILYFAFQHHKKRLTVSTERLEHLHQHTFDITTKD
jgi:hypothetical protein